jgi:antitoxin component YwqK of YwqJK toxin-antitoxin module
LGQLSAGRLTTFADRIAKLVSSSHGFALVKVAVLSTASQVSRNTRNDDTNQRELCALSWCRPDKLKSVRHCNLNKRNALKMSFQRLTSLPLFRLFRDIGVPLFCVWAFLAVATAMAQGQADLFDPPKIPPSETLDGLKFGGEADQGSLEGIQAEAVPGNAALQVPNFGEYGPVSSPQGSSNAADQAPSIRSQIDVIESSGTLPNEYKGQSIFPDWARPSATQPANSPPMMQEELPSEPRRRVEDAGPRLRIDSMNSIESANRNFTSQKHEVIRERYEDGSVKIVRTITQDEEGNYYNDGGWLLYDRQRRPIASGTFVRGAMDGTWERIHEAGSGGIFSQLPFSLFDGPFKSSATFKRNKLDGVWTIADRSGKVICTITYKDGVRNGLATWNFPRTKMREVRFKDGVPDGLVKQWDQQGKLVLRERFVDGRKIIRRKTTFANQSIESEREFRDQKLSAAGTDNWWAAKPATLDRVGEQIQHGPVSQWYPNRQPKMTGRYINGQRDGLFTWWHPTHNKKAEGNFENGKRQGNWIYWHESGMKRSEGEFKDDEPFGVWRIWNEDGKLVESKSFPLESAISDESDGFESAPLEEDQDEAALPDVDSDESGDFKLDLEKQDPESDEDSAIEATSSEEQLEAIQGEPTEAVSEDPGAIGEGG